MRRWLFGLGFSLLIPLAFQPILSAQNKSRSLAASSQPFDPHDLTGTWIGDDHKGGGRWDNAIPEPPLTEWAKQHLLYKEGISHDPLSGSFEIPTTPPTLKLRLACGYFIRPIFTVCPRMPPMGNIPERIANR